MITLTHKEMLERFPVKYNVNTDNCTVQESFSGGWNCPVEAANIVLGQSLSWSRLSALYKVLVKAPRFFGRKEKIGDALNELYNEHQKLKCSLVKLDPEATYTFENDYIPKIGDKVYVAVTRPNSLGVGVHELKVTKLNLYSYDKPVVEVIISSEKVDHLLHYGKDGSLSVSGTYWYTFKDKQQACEFLKQELQSQITKQQELINSL